MLRGDEAPHPASCLGEERPVTEEMAELFWPVVTGEPPREGPEASPIAAREDDCRVAVTHHPLRQRSLRRGFEPESN